MTHITRHGDVVDAPQVWELWEELHDYVQKDLLEWLNLTEPDEDDKARLITLYESGRFHSYNCPTCGTRVQSADVEDQEWEHFQGVRQPNDSFFGNSDIYTEETISRQCDSCRCHAPVPVVTYPPEY